MWRARVRTLAIVGVAMAAIAAMSLVRSGVAEAAAVRPGYGYLWLDDATTAVSVEYTPSPGYQRNSAGGQNTVTRRGTGSYDVYFPGLGRFGTPTVTPYAVSSERCKIGSWGAAPSGKSGTVVNVRCTTRTGSPVNVLFSITYAYAVTSTSKGAYLWSNRPSPTLNTAYTPSTSYQYNSSGKRSTVIRSEPGWYEVHLNGLTGDIETMSVVATGTASVGAYCNDYGGWPTATYIVQFVGCFRADGQPADSAFALTMLDSGNTMFGSVASASYAWFTCYDDIPPEAGPVHTCVMATSTNGDATADWLGSGQYLVHLPVNMSGGNIQITPATGADAFNASWGRCSVTYWSTSSVMVNCVDINGNPPSTNGATFRVNFVS
jgi:hypothetical protein